MARENLRSRRMASDREIAFGCSERQASMASAKAGAMRKPIRSVETNLVDGVLPSIGCRPRASLIRRGRWIADGMMSLFLFIIAFARFSLKSIEDV